ncbi:DUF1992 domain-containing protein [Halobacillus salinarum]|uniref:DUF1992 domain-containing protein n=1 Tax=Halobacillus salinarum TaxID=2932257 RepID=A0ABY4EFS6_9BACI|nr:DnaJ family domain-containing protein [Halobacillus salinarum]UOQ42913.1 DUF1992 domain-containing protein [Halobacillus salinarum]
MDRKYNNDMIGEILEQSGEKDNYSGPGKGKPLPKDYTSKDVYQNFQKAAKNAGYLPGWIKLQKEISALVQSCQTESDLVIINEKIKQHNKICPVQMQKNKISFDNLAKAKEVW